LAIGARLVQARQEHLRQPMLERHLIDAERRIHRTRCADLALDPAQRAQRLLDRGDQGRARVFRTRPAQGIQPAHAQAQ